MRSSRGRSKNPVGLRTGTRTATVVCVVLSVDCVAVLFDAAMDDAVWTPAPGSADVVEW